MTKNVLVLDPANTTGYCVYQVDESTSTMDIVKWGFLEVKQDTDYLGDQYLDLASQVETLIKDNSIDIIAVEDYFFSRRSPQGANLNCSYRAAIHMKARELGLHYEILNISLWKKFINGRSTATVNQKKVWGKEPAKKLMTQQSLFHKWNIKFPNHSISNLTGKPVKFKYDIVDAVAMAIFHGSIYLNMKNITYSVVIAKDHIWKKIPKGTFDYGGIYV